MANVCARPMHVRKHQNCRLNSFPPNHLVMSNDVQIVFVHQASQKLFLSNTDVQFNIQTISTNLPVSSRQKRIQLRNWPLWTLILQQLTIHFIYSPKSLSFSYFTKTIFFHSTNVYSEVMIECK